MRITRTTESEFDEARGNRSFFGAYSEVKELLLNAPTDSYHKIEFDEPEKAKSARATLQNWALTTQKNKITLSFAVKGKAVFIWKKPV